MDFAHSSSQPDCLPAVTTGCHTRCDFLFVRWRSGVAGGQVSLAGSSQALLVDSALMVPPARPQGLHALIGSAKAKQTALMQDYNAKMTQMLEQQAMLERIQMEQKIQVKAASVESPGRYYLYLPWTVGCMTPVILPCPYPFFTTLQPCSMPSSSHRHYLALPKPFALP